MNDTFSTFLNQEAFCVFDYETLKNYVRAMFGREDFENLTAQEIYDFARSDDQRNTYAIGRLAKGSFGNSLIDKGYAAEGEALLTFLIEKPRDKRQVVRNQQLLMSYGIKGKL